VKVKNDEYPDINRIAASVEERQEAHLTFSVAELERLVKVMKALKAKQVRLVFDKEDRTAVVKVTPVDSLDDRFYGFVMPCLDREVEA